MIRTATILGAGHMGHHMGRQLIRCGIIINMVFNRTVESARLLSEELSSSYTDEISEIPNSSDLYVICVSDDAISVIAEEISQVIGIEQIVIHTAGIVPLEEISSRFLQSGVFYPLQSLRKEWNVDFSTVPLCITASNENVQSTLVKLAKKISDHVVLLTDEERAKLHLGAVLVNNFVNHIYTLAHDFIENEGLDFNMFKPLIQETTERIIQGLPPSTQQTGPAIRNDRGTIRNHRQLLSEYPSASNLYQYLSRHIKNWYNENRSRF